MMNFDNLENMQSGDKDGSGQCRNSDENYENSVNLQNESSNCSNSPPEMDLVKHKSEDFKLQIAPSSEEDSLSSLGRLDSLGKSDSLGKESNYSRFDSLSRFDSGISSDFQIPLPRKQSLIKIYKTISKFSQGLIKGKQDSDTSPPSSGLCSAAAKKRMRKKNSFYSDYSQGSFSDELEEVKELEEFNRKESDGASPFLKLNKCISRKASRRYSTDSLGSGFSSRKCSYIPSSPHFITSRKNSQNSSLNHSGKINS